MQELAWSIIFIIWSLGALMDSLPPTTFNMEFRRPSNSWRRRGDGGGRGGFRGGFRGNGFNRPTRKKPPEMRKKPWNGGVWAWCPCWSRSLLLQSSRMNLIGWCFIIAVRLSSSSAPQLSAPFDKTEGGGRGAEYRVWTWSLRRDFWTEIRMWHPKMYAPLVRVVSYNQKYFSSGGWMVLRI